MKHVLVVGRSLGQSNPDDPQYTGGLVVFLLRDVPEDEADAISYTACLRRKLRRLSFDRCDSVQVEGAGGRNHL